MTNILKKYPAPWKVMPEGHIETANEEKIVFGLDCNLLEFIAETVNDSARRRITEALCKCSCGWQGIIFAWSPYQDNNGNSLCPDCANIVKVV